MLGAQAWEAGFMPQLPCPGWAVLAADSGSELPPEADSCLDKAAADPILSPPGVYQLLTVAPGHPECM